VAYNPPVVAAPSAARAASGTSGAVPIDPGMNVHTALVVTAVSGMSPTLDVSLEWSLDGGSTWLPANDAFTQVTAAGTQLSTFAAKAPLARVRWDIGGASPSFTFDVRVFVTN
jgi:hypothetical protein